MLERARERVVARVPLVLEVLAGAIGIAAFAAVVYAGLAGNQTTTANLAPTAIFVLFWVGVPARASSSATCSRRSAPGVRPGGWPAGWRRGVAGADLPTPLTYPARLGRWPAALGVLAFAWIELVYTGRTDPSHLAVLALVYAGAMLAGMSFYGVETWTRSADGFGVAFGLLALLAPLDWSGRTLRLRPPLSGATAMPQVAGAVAVVVTMIGTTTFDGFSQGSVWTGTNGLLQRLTDAFDGFGLGREAAIQGAGTVGLLAVVLIVAGLYRLGVAGMQSVGGVDLSGDELARRFAHTLIPIAFAYLVAHYFSLLLFQGQAIVYLISDPLGQGSDIFGTSSSTIDYSLIGAGGIWYVQVAALVMGHVGGLAWPMIGRSRSGATRAPRRGRNTGCCS